VTQILIDILLIGVVAYVVTRRKATPRVIAPTPEPEARPSDQPEPAIRRAPPQPVAARKPAAPIAPRAIPAAHTPTTSPHYLLGGPHPGQRRDAMAETLGMMSGPGLCTPVRR
jgi:hypothetical protein